MRKLLCIVLCMLMIASTFAVAASALPQYTQSDLDEAKGYDEGEYDYIYKLTFDDAPLGMNTTLKRLYYGVADSVWNPYGFVKQTSAYAATVCDKSGDSNDGDNDKYMRIDGDDISAYTSSGNTWNRFFVADANGVNLATGNTLSFEFDMRWQGLGEKGVVGTARTFTLLGFRQNSANHTFLTMAYQSGENKDGEPVADQKLRIYTPDGNDVAVLDKDDESFTNIKVVYYTATQTYDVYVNDEIVVNAFSGASENQASVSNVRDEYDDNFMTTDRELAYTVAGSGNGAHFVFFRQDWSKTKYTSMVVDIDNLYVREVKDGAGKTTYYSNGFETNNGGNFYYNEGQTYKFYGSNVFDIGGASEDKHLVINSNGSTNSCFDIYDRYQLLQNGNVTIDFDVQANNVTNTETDTTFNKDDATGALLRYSDGQRNYYLLHVSPNGELYTAHHDGSGFTATGVKVAETGSDKWTNVQLSIEVVSKGTERETCDWRTGKDSCRQSYKFYLWVDGKYIKSWTTDRVAIDGYKSINAITYTPSALSADPGVTPAYYFENTATDKRFADADGNLYWLVYDADGNLVAGSSDYSEGSIKLTSNKNAPGDFLRFFTDSQTWLKGAIDNVKIYEGVYTDADVADAAKINFSDYTSIDQLGPQFIRSEGVYIENGELVIPEGETFGWVDTNKIYGSYCDAAAVSTWSLDYFYNVELKTKTNVKGGALVTVDYPTNGAEDLVTFDEDGKLEREGVATENVTVNNTDSDRYSDISVVFAHYGRFGGIFVDGLYTGVTSLTERATADDAARFMISGETRIAELYIHQGEMRELAKNSGEIFEIDPDKDSEGVKNISLKGVWENTSLEQSTLVPAENGNQAYFKWDYSTNAAAVDNNRGTVYANHYLENNVTVFEYELRFTPNEGAAGSKAMSLVEIAKSEGWECHLKMYDNGVLYTPNFGTLYADAEGTPLKVATADKDFSKVAVILNAVNGTVSYRSDGDIPYYLDGNIYKRAENIDIKAVYPAYNADAGETRVLTNTFPNSGFYGIYELQGMKIYTVDNQAKADLVGVQVYTKLNNIRLVGGLDMPYYSGVGFELEVRDVEGNKLSGTAKAYKDNIVYSSVKENGVTLYPSDYGWRYFFTANIIGVDQTTPVKLIITPYTEVLGEKLKGETLVLTIDFTSDSMNDWTYEFEVLSSSEIEKLTVDGKRVGLVEGKTDYYRATEGNGIPSIDEIEVLTVSKNADVVKTAISDGYSVKVTSDDGKSETEFNIHFVETAALDAYDLDTYLIPYWEGNIVYHEIALFGGDSDTATLLYSPEHILSVRSCDLKTEYIEGVDYKIVDGEIHRIKGGRIPYYTDKQFYPESTSTSVTGSVGTLKNGGYILSASKAVFQQNSISVTYTHNGGDNVYVPATTTKLNKAKGMLERGEEVNIVFFGDSITAGCNSTGYETTAPYTPKWTDMVNAALEAEYPEATINYYNTAVPGWHSHTALKTVADAESGASDEAKYKADGSDRYEYEYRITEYKPDLLVLAFGMNDGATNSTTSGKSAGGFANDTKKVIDFVLEANPECEILLVSTMLPNTATAAYGKQNLYEDALLKLANGGTVGSNEYKGYANVDVMTMTSVSEYVLQYKDFWDVSSNNTNHPNDFLVRIYAQTALKTLGLN